MNKRADEDLDIWAEHSQAHLYISSRRTFQHFVHGEANHLFRKKLTTQLLNMSLKKNVPGNMLLPQVLAMFTYHGK
jgi:hypothetical protein